MRATSSRFVKDAVVIAESVHAGPTTPAMGFELLRIPDLANPTTVLVAMLQPPSHSKSLMV